MSREQVDTFRGRKLPDDDALARLHREGQTVQEIADAYGATYEAVRQRFVSMGVQATTPRPRYGLPWRAREDQRQQAVIQHWYAYRRKQMGLSKSDAEAAQVDQWIEYMEGNNAAGQPLSIFYDKDDGFLLRRRRVGDADYLSVD